MKIKNRGEAWSHEVTCGRCKSVLEIGGGDLDYYEYAGPVFRVQCPVCKAYIELRENVIPSHIREELKTIFRNVLMRDDG